MRLHGRHSFRAPRDVVWEALLDPQVLARTLPGCEDLSADGENRFRGTLTMKIGPVQGRFDGAVELSDLVAPDRYTISIKGQGAAGFVDGTGLVRLEPAADGTTVIYDIEARVGGRIAGVGQRLLDSTARAVTSQALEGLGRQLEFRQAAGAAAAGEAGPPAHDGAGDDAAPPPAPPAAPGKAEFAAGVAREVAVDLAGDRPWRLIAGGVVVFAALAAWWLFG